MDKRWIILALGAVAIVVWMRRANASQSDVPMVLMFDPATGENYLAPSPDIATLAPSADAIGGATDTTPAPLWSPSVPEANLPLQAQPMPTAAADAYESRLAAFLATIRQFESGGRYDVLYGGQTFSDFTQHPNVRVPFKNPRTGKMDYSTAAGAYQINYPTWTSEIQPALNLPDFSPQSQDMAARFLIERKTNAAPYLVSGDIPGAFRAASAKWASLPGSTAMQNPQSIQAALTQFNHFIGA